MYACRSYVVHILLLLLLFAATEVTWYDLNKIYEICIILCMLVINEISRGNIFKKLTWNWHHTLLGYFCDHLSHQRLHPLKSLLVRRKATIVSIWRSHWKRSSSLVFESVLYPLMYHVVNSEKNIIILLQLIILGDKLVKKVRWNKNEIQFCRFSHMRWSFSFIWYLCDK